MAGIAGDGPLRVAVVEDERLYCDLLCQALSREAGFQVVGAFGDADSALAAIPSLRPDVALLDIELGCAVNGVQVGLLLRRNAPRLGVVLLSNHHDPRFLPIGETRDMAGWSYLLKKSVEDVRALRRAIEGAAAQLVVLDAHIVSTLALREDSPLSRLNERERRLLQLMALGLNNAGVARQLVVSEKTVENQVSMLYQTLGLSRTSDRSAAADGVHPRVQAVLMYVQASRADAVPR